MRSQRIQEWPLWGGRGGTFGVGGGGWSVMFTAFRFLVLRSFTLYGAWWTERLAAVIDSTR
jgi:hypothetical protein